VTRTDLLEAVAGDLPSVDAPARPKITKYDQMSGKVGAQAGHGTDR
jgi:hypothetical protein